MGRDLTRGYASNAFDIAYFYWAYTVELVVRLDRCGIVHSSTFVLYCTGAVLAK